MATINRLNHAVLWVSDLGRSLDFYTGVLEMAVVDRRGDQAAFLRASGSAAHHDLGLFAVGDQAPRPEPQSIGLYHLAWEVPDIETLAEFQQRLADAGSLVGMSDHGVSKSLYAKDPDGIEFEVMWLTPRESWGEAEHNQPIAPLNIERELETWGAKA